MYVWGKLDKIYFYGFSVCQEVVEGKKKNYPEKKGVFLFFIRMTGFEKFTC
jgi:hypothetical protein